MWAPLLHRAAAAGFAPAWLRFQRALANPERSQRKVLRRIMGTLAGTERSHELGLTARTTYEEFTARCAPTTFAELRERIELQRMHPGRSILGPAPVDFVPTSGSGGARKWIPATPGSGRELHEAAGAWLVDLAMREPGVLDGRHYWSLSWLPDELRREGVTTDDLSALPSLRRRLVSGTMAVPDAVARLATSAASRRATAVHLAACGDLRLVSVWSPTFLLAILDELDRWRDPIAAILDTGAWREGWDATLGPVPASAAPYAPLAASLLREAPRPLDADALQRLWPQLRVVSAWDSSTSATFAGLVRQRLPRVRLLGKGLWATEGVVTIPFRGRFPAAITSHFLEFECLGTGKISPVWALEAGQRVRPLLTTGAGLLRYRLDDRLCVTGRLGRTPCLRFDGRLGGVDLVGEKVTAELAEAALAELQSLLPVHPLSLLAVTPVNGRPRYLLLAESRQADLDEGAARDLVERVLRKIHHYALARDAGQLEHADVVVREHARRIHDDLRRRAVAIDGAMKIEPVFAANGPALISALSSAGSGGERR